MTTTGSDAAIRQFADGTKPSGQDVKWGLVDYTDGSLTFISNVSRIKSDSDSYTLWIDTNANDPGPEYKMHFYPNSDQSSLKAVETFASKGKSIKCGNWWVYGDQFAEPEVGFDVARSCIGKPSKVRVSFRASFASGTDWLPAKEKFTPWVRYN